MKNLLKYATLAMISAVVLVGCRPDSFEDIGTAKEVLPTFAGNWKLNKVTQVDEDAKSKGPGFTFQTMDLTTLFPYTDFKFSLLMNASNSPTTFTTTPGSSPAVISVPSGTWSVDNGTMPTAIYFKNGAVIDTATLGAYPSAPNNILQFRLVRKDVSGKVVLSYTYEFIKQ